MRLATLALAALFSLTVAGQEKFPDGTPIPDWFRQTEVVNPETLGTQYTITDYGVVNDSTLVQTAKIQAVIDQASRQGGGVIVIPAGTYLSGSLFFKPKTHLRLEKGAVLKGSDDISDFALIDTRMEGQNLKYFAALVNANKVDGFTISGEGTLNGNGHRYWRSFWLRRKYNPKCTNLEEMRPRLLFISNSNDVQVSGIHLINSPFWTTHLYRCNRVKLLNLHIFAPAKPVKAPSSDAIDIDVCSDVLVKGCYMSVNDDAVALKGGKGPYADKDINNGSNRNIIIEDCTYGFCHSGLTCGSESIHNHNIILRRCTISNASRLLWLKMRPDTPQHYEYILVDDVKGNAKSLIYIKPWTQFFDLKGRKDIPMSYSNNVTLRNITFDCDVFFDASASEQYELKNFLFENLHVKAKNGACDRSMVENFEWKNVQVTEK